MAGSRHYFAVGLRHAGRAVLAAGVLAACSLRTGWEPGTNGPIVCPAEVPDAPDVDLSAVDASEAGTAPLVRLRPSVALGRRRFVVNARVQPRGAPTRTWVEYRAEGGPPRQTSPRPLPGRLAAHFHESWDEGPAGWESGIKGEALHGVPQGGASGAYVRHREPSGTDPNHVDGIGTIHLAQYLHVGSYEYRSNVHLGGGDPDFRDARVRLQVRGEDFVASGSELLFWAQAHHDISKQHSRQWRAANWALTGSPLTSALASGEWTSVEFRLWNDVNEWTYAGKSLAQHRDNYQYLSLDRTLSNLNADFLHVLAFVDEARPPRGGIAFDELDVTYRNHNVLASSNGGRLVGGPMGSQEDPAGLTDGHRHGEGRSWQSPPSPTAPVELVYELARPVVVRSIQVHQHLRWPARDVGVALSRDGHSWADAAAFSLAERAPLGPNYSYGLKRDLAATARFVKVTVRSGYRTEAWGLGEVEVFGDGAEEQTDDDWYGVSTELADLDPNATYRYRVVSSSVLGTVSSEERTFHLPADGRPTVRTLPPADLTPTSAKIVARVAPLGRRAEALVEYGDTPTFGRRSARVYVGIEETPRSVLLPLEGLRPSTTYYYRVVATGPAGIRCGAVETFTTK